MKHCFLALFISLLFSSCVESKINSQIDPLEDGESRFNLKCSYQTKISGEMEQTTSENCAYIAKEDKVVVTKKDLSRIAFDGDNPACLALYGTGDVSLYYILQSGKSIRALHFDNGCDYFEEGLARGIVEEKIIFFDKKLDIILKTDFPFAYPFSNGEAKVCRGFTWRESGEHRVMEGGECANINLKGELISPFKAP